MSTHEDWLEQIAEINPGEEWRAIPGYERTYAVSSHGRIYSRPRPKARGGLLSISVGKRGYPHLGLVQDGIQKHTRFTGLLRSLSLDLDRKHTRLGI